MRTHSSSEALVGLPGSRTVVRSSLVTTGFIRILSEEGRNFVGSIIQVDVDSYLGVA